MGRSALSVWSFLLMAVLFGTWVSLLSVDNRYEWCRLIILMGMVIVGKKIFLKNQEAVTASGATLMAIGIFINGAMQQFTIIDRGIGKDLTIFLLLVWLFITASYVQSYRQKTFYDRHLKHPVSSFALGTWIAGTSVMGVAILQRLPDLRFLVYILSLANVVFWIFFAKHCIVNFRKIIFTQALRKNVHGVLLLSTVSTQSIVVLFNAMFTHPVLTEVSRWMIIFGVFLYIIGFVLILNRYVRIGKWTLADEWQNTNCIIHGAMSITGLASTVSEAVPPNLIFLIWVWVLFWFIIVEVIDLIRVLVRIRLYGATKGIGTHYMTQWSRNFTFGMFYAFTQNFNLMDTSFADSSLVNTIRIFILTYGAWIVLALLLNECLLYLKANIREEIGEKFPKYMTFKKRS